MERKPVGIIGAMRVEVDAILSAAEIEKVEVRSSMEFHVGTLSGVPVVAAQCSPGKVNSALCAQVMADFYAPRAILNIGVAGGLGEDVHIGDVVIATACVEHDWDGTPLGQPLGAINFPPDDRKILEIPCDEALAAKLQAAAETLYGGARSVHRGIVATGDQFIADPEKGKFLRETFRALACEMEGGSIAHACLLNGIPCAVLRTISDNANDDAKVDFPAFAEESARKAQRLLTSVIREL